MEDKKYKNQDDWVNNMSQDEWGCDTDKVIKTIMESENPLDSCESFFVQILSLMKIDYYQRLGILESTKNWTEKINNTIKK